jgi:hypothetical protein
MLRLTLLLCLGMFAALMTLGEDQGQLRPGLAKAAAEGRLDEVWAEARAKAAPVVLAASPALPLPEPLPEPLPKPARAPEPAPGPAPEPVPGPAPVLADAGQAPEPRAVVTVVAEPVFTLSSLGNEAVPGEVEAVAERAAAALAPDPVPEPVAEPAALPETPPGGGEGTIWYVNASSVNVRAAPSTEAEILGRLADGEAALMVMAVDAEWARIVIQGDGMEGYVALRYLSPEAP